jgi:hypothetical protein
MKINEFLPMESPFIGKPIDFLTSNACQVNVTGETRLV